MTPHGKFIVVEGTVDGAGKSTLMTGLSLYFRNLGLNVRSTFEPGDTDLGKTLREILLDTNTPLTPEAELFLFLADRAQHLAEIQADLRLGKWVLCDRFSLSTLAYQGARNYFPTKTLESLCQEATLGVMAHPDLTIVLDLPVAKMAERLEGVKRDRFESMDPEYYQRVHDNYHHYIGDLRWSRAYAVIDATLPKPTVLKKALEAIEAHTKEETSR